MMRTSESDTSGSAAAAVSHDVVNRKQSQQAADLEDLDKFLTRPGQRSESRSGARHVPGAKMITHLTTGMRAARRCTYLPRQIMGYGLRPFKHPWPSLLPCANRINTTMRDA